MVEETTAKEWVYSVIAAEAITERGVTQELPPSRDRYGTVYTQRWTPCNQSETLSVTTYNIMHSSLQ